jgi:hypothetical protein
LLPALLPFPSRILQCPSQQEFNLSIQAAQIIIGPPAYAIEDLRIDPNQK